MSRSLKLSLALVGVAIVVVSVLLAVSGSDDEPSARDPGSGELVRADSARLSVGREAEFVEFLDFECEACIALFPVIEELRSRYGDRVAFVVRHMPLHGNSFDAALAAEAAAEQGRFGDMYRKLFSQPERWGHRESSQRDVFFSYASELGLDMASFARDYDGPRVRARIEQSTRDGSAHGVEGTPTFFLNGERLDPTSISDLEESLKAVLSD